MGVSFKTPNGAEQALVEQSAAAAGEELLKGARGYGHNDFKIPLVKRTLRAVVTDAVRRA